MQMFNIFDIQIVNKYFDLIILLHLFQEYFVSVIGFHRKYNRIFQYSTWNLVTPQFGSAQTEQHAFYIYNFDVEKNKLIHGCLVGYIMERHSYK